MIKEIEADHLQRQRLLGGVGEGGRQAQAAEPEEHRRRAAGAGPKPTRSTLFEKHKVLNEREVHARYEIMLEQYVKTINVEAQLMVLMANRYILPAALALSDGGGAERRGGQGGRRRLGETKKLLDRLHQDDRRLPQGAPTSSPRRSSTRGGSAEKHAKYMRDTVVPAMGALRELGDTHRDDGAVEHVAAADLPRDAVHQVAARRGSTTRAGLPALVVYGVTRQVQTRNCQFHRADCVPAIASWALGVPWKLAVANWELAVGSRPLATLGRETWQRATPQKTSPSWRGSSPSASVPACTSAASARPACTTSPGRSSTTPSTRR